jgi:V8-like Glu-specific endopeptidase
VRPRHAIATRRVTPRFVVGLGVAASLVVGGTVAVTEVALAKQQAPAGRARHAISAAHATRTVVMTGVVRVIGAAAQAAARSYWTPARMAAATGAGSEAGENAAASAIERQDATIGASEPTGKEPPHGTPNSEPFSGVPTVGALFYTKGSDSHFCTASVINSTVGSLILTAAHCVYSSSGYSQNLEFIPGYVSGSSPYGAWPVTQITVAKDWRQGQDPNLDVAFLDVVPPPNSVGPIEQVTGALQLAFALPDAQHITVIGYNDTDQKPIMCDTTSFKFRPDQMEFYCRGFWYGTSGGPWILKYNSGSGTGTIYGVIGGYEAGGDVSWASYAAALEEPAQELLAEAEATAGTANSGTAKSSGFVKSSGTATLPGTQVKATVG